MLPGVLRLRVAVAGRRAVVPLARALHGVRLVLPAAQQGLVLSAVSPSLPRRRLPRHDTVHALQEVPYYPSRLLLYSNTHIMTTSGTVKIAY